MYLTAVDLSWENVPPRTWQGRGWGERPWWDRVVPSREARVLSPARERAKPGHGGQIWLTSGNTDKPSPGFPESHGQRQMTGTGMRTPAQTGVGSLRTQRACGPLPHATWKSRSLAAFTWAHLLPGHPGGHGRVSLWRRGTVVEDAPGDGSPGAPHPLPPLLPLPVQPRRVLSPQTMETTSSVPQETWLCVSGCPFCPIPSLPSPPRGTERRAGSICPPRRQRKEKVFYIRYLFNISF